jgi:hypothetical protein
MHENFSDWYAAVSLRHNAQTLEARWKTVEAVADQLTLQNMPHLTRVFFSRPGGDEMRNGIRKAAKDADPSYLIEDDNIELAVIAGGVIAEVLRVPSDLATAVALAIDCMDAHGLRKAQRLQDVVDLTARHLVEQSISIRKVDDSRALDLDIAELKSKLETKGGVVVNSVDTVWNAFEIVIKDLLNQHAKHTESINLLFDATLNRQREESDILWWLFSEHTLDGKKAFSEIDIPEGCFWGAKDLAKLTRFLPGPVAAPAFLHKMLRLVRQKAPSKIKISEAVDACTYAWKQQWMGSISILNFPDLFPLLFAISKSVEAGGGSSWTAAFEHATGLSADNSASPDLMATQIYNEILLQRALSQGA